MCWSYAHPADPAAAQDDDIPGIVRYRTYEVLAAEVDNPRLRWAYLPYSMHMAGPREAIQHMIIRRNYGCVSASFSLAAPSCFGLLAPPRCLMFACPKSGVRYWFAALSWLAFHVLVAARTERVTSHDGRPLRSAAATFWGLNSFCMCLMLHAQVHALHHWPRYGGQQEQPHGRGLLRRLRSAGDCKYVRVSPTHTWPVLCASNPNRVRFLIFLTTLCFRRIHLPEVALRAC